MAETKVVEVLLPKAHTHKMKRKCGAFTIVNGQSTVFVNGELWAVNGDPNSHGSGRLIAGNALNIWVEGKNVIVHTPDRATVDNAGHPPGQTDTAEGSSDTFAY